MHLCIEQQSSDLMNALSANVSVVYNMQGTAQLAQNIPYSALASWVTGAGKLSSYMYGVLTPEPRILFIPMDPSLVNKNFHQHYIIKNHHQGQKQSCNTISNHLQVPNNCLLQMIIMLIILMGCFLNFMQM